MVKYYEKNGFYTVDEASQLYAMIPISMKEFVKNDTGQEPPPEYVQKLTDWFVKYLKP